MSLEPEAVTFEELLAHSRWVRALARNLVADPHSADDAEQQVWMAALERPPTAGGDLRAWLGRVLRRRVSNLRRADRRRQENERQPSPRGGLPSAEEVVSRAETRTIVAQAVLALEEPYRTTVLLRYFEGRSAHAIARHMEVPASTVRTRLQRALSRLREMLARKLDENGGAWRAGLLPLLQPTTRSLLGGHASFTLGVAVMKFKMVALAAATFLIGLLAWTLHEGTPSSSRVDRTGQSVTADGPSSESALVGLARSDDGAASHEVQRSQTEEGPDRDTTASRSKEHTIVGRIVDADSGTPVPGARVALLHFSEKRAGWVVSARVLGRAACAPDGRFSITVKVPARGLIDAVARAPGYSKAGAALRGHRADGTLDLGNIGLTQSASVKGVILANGEPVEGVTVVAAPEGVSRTQRLDTADSAPDLSRHEEAGLAVPIGAVATTDHLGRFVLAGLRKEQRLAIRAGSGSARVEVTGVLAPTTALTIRLDGGASVLIQLRGQSAPSAWRVIAHYTPKVERGVPRPDSVMLELEVHGRRERRVWFAPGDVELNIMTLAGEAQHTTRIESLAAGDSHTVEWPYEVLLAATRGSLRVAWPETSPRPHYIFLVAGEGGKLIARKVTKVATEAVLADLEAGSYEVVSASADRPPVTWGWSDASVRRGRESPVVLRPVGSGTLEILPPDGVTWLVKLRRNARAWPFLLVRPGAPSEFVVAGRCRVRGRARLHVPAGTYALTVRKVGSNHPLFERDVECKDKQTVKVTGD